MSKTMGYLYKLLPDGKIELTHEAEINIFNIDKIFRKVKAKGRRVDFELVALRSRDYGPVNIAVKRSDITYDVMSHFITSYYNGDRSVQRHPYTDDLFDDDILDDLGMCVLTYKYYYAGSRFLADMYYPCHIYTPYNEVHELLDQRTEEAIKQYEEHEKRIKADNKINFNWKEISHGNKDKNEF